VIAPTSDPAAARFRDGLLEAVRKGLSGRLDGFSDSQEIGSAVLVGGRIAWAICRYQPEDLGSFLRRLGHVSKDQLSNASTAYSELGGTKKLGRILEEERVVSRSVLRRCLQLHVRMALSCLLRDDRLVGMWTEGRLTSDEELSFSLDEVFPELQRSGHSAARSGPELSLSSLLDEVGVTPGYRSAVITDAWGTALGVHGDADDDPLQASLLATAAATLVESGRHTSKRSGLGDLDFLMIEGEHGSASIRWADSDRRYLVAVFLEAGGQTGVARHRIAACAEKVRLAISNLNDDLE